MAQRQRLPRPILISLPRSRMVSPAVDIAATSSASDSNFRCRKGEWPACSDRRGNNLPRPILISVAAKENGSACNGRGGYVVRFRFHSPLQRRKMVPPATAVAATRSASDSILRCREGEWFRLQNATTPPMHRFLISGPDLGIDAASSLLQLRIVRLQRSRGVQAEAGCHEGGIILSKKPPEWHLSLPRQRPVSDSNFLCGNRKWFRLLRS